MTALRKAAKKALEALDRSDYFGWQSNIPIIKSLREALAQPEPEPVAWMYEWDGKRHLTFTDQRFIEKSHPHFNKSSPLYTHPPQRKPLTDEEIIMLTADTWGNASIAPQLAPAFARAIERAHGIGEKE